MKNVCKRIIAVSCIALMIMSMPGVTVLADEISDEIYIDEVLEVAAEPDIVSDISQEGSQDFSEDINSSLTPADDPFQMPTQEIEDDKLANIDETTIYDEADDPLLVEDGIEDTLVGALESTGNSTLDNFINDSRFTNGASWAWNKSPILASFTSQGCCAYCADYVKYCYGINDPRQGASFTNVNEIRQGDVLTVGNQHDGNGHWFICLKRSGNSLYVAEGNCSNRVRIGWNYSISGSRIAGTDYGFNTGYHFLDPVPVGPTDINNCSVTLDIQIYTYNGSAKTPAVIVKNGSITLSPGTDYTVSYSNNVNAGTATATVTGKGNYTGSTSKNFLIRKKSATLSFYEGSINTKDLNTTFTNYLTQRTDGIVTFTSSNISVATVNSSSGLVTTKGVGTTTITATATEGTNYEAASASYTLLVGISVGSNVVATFDENTGTVYFYSSGGELWRDWVDKLGVSGWKIKSIKVKSGTVYLPSDSSGGNDDFDDKMFKGLGDLEELDISRFNTSRVTDMSNMFCGCQSLKNLDLSNFDTSRVKDMSGMFLSCSLLKNLDLSSFDTSNVENMANMFKDCGCLTNLNLSSFSTSKVRDMSWMFSGCVNLTDLDLRNFNTSNVTNMRGMFWCCLVLTNLNLSSFNTANVTDMYGMFTSCHRLTNLDLSSFNTANVTNMEQMFDGCNALTNLDLSSFNTSKVTNMHEMFWACNNLTNLDLSSFNTANVTDMNWMFSGCRSLTNLNLGSFDTSKVTNMNCMFNKCDSLTELDLSSFNTASVKDMAAMFSNCNSLMTLDLSSFDTSNVTSMGSMFSKCDNLQLLKTPKKQTQSGVVLPDTMYDSADTSYTELPLLSKSIVLTKNHSIQSYNLTLSPTSYTYDGNAKKPSVTVKKGTTTLTKNTDYTVAYSKNINAGTAKVTVTGKGNYTGTITKTFTIAKATPTLKFASSSLSKKTGDAAFTNALTKTTDGVVTFKSSDTSVATVNSTSGKVTIKGVGTVAITATAEEGTNYKSGNVSYTLTVTAPSPAGFSDVQDPSHPYYKAIYWAAEAGITKGYSDGTFGINRACTRSEAVMFLWRLAGKPAPVDALSSPFKDVPKSHAHYKAILWAAQKGITKGYSDGTFGINKTCTRGQIMTFIWRFKGQPAPKAAAKSPFSDVPKNHAYYKAILWGSQNKITNGFSDGTFGINKDCTRGQIVTFLYRIK